MDTLLSLVNWIASNYQLVISAIIGILSGVIAICLLIPGAEPEATLQKIVDFLTKFSKK